MRSVCIYGTGSYVPEEVVTNEQLAATAPTKPEWVETRLGIKTRRRARKDESTSDMAVEAARKALEMAKMEPEEVQLIILATVTPDRLVPSAATTVQHKLGAGNAVAFDINAACPGFIFALSTGTQFIKNGFFKNALIIGSDTLSKVNNYQHRNCVFFGDGAGAIVIKDSNSSNGVLAIDFHSDGEGTDDLTVRGCGSEWPASVEVLEQGGQFLIMDAKKVYKKAVVGMPESIKTTLNIANLTTDDITFVVPHQPNISLLKDCIKELGIPEDKLIITLDQYGNFSSGNIPLALDKINRERRLKEGDILAFTSAGAGWTWGSIIMRWGE
ncbi:3-oxoacyl-[acyl-carrier-protein] synthase-3 [Anaerovirgula multivorans]|uniref:3-oxoacyl-[acyl-carrier-protein] synthase-3 n=1 Tax=Anaerovirgula multivorans TaxID=312168 RepID=A0A239J682_9FIRM|nr:beta-ketoacyl-ACP synthase III [Anaerovirgula multivorans]SNT01401.1 3-oxoacyl-[acyl-carrier-protein] synthase-3 [Anaerovirgula multivorans]